MNGCRKVLRRRCDLVFARNLPFDEIDEAALSLRFTLHLPVTAMFSPGHWELFKMALDLVGCLFRASPVQQELVVRRSHYPLG